MDDGGAQVALGSGVGWLDPFAALRASCPVQDGAQAVAVGAVPCSLANGTKSSGVVHLADRLAPHDAGEGRRDPRADAMRNESRSRGLCVARGIGFCLEPLALICAGSAHIEAEP